MTLITKRIIISGLTMATIFRKEKGGIYDNDKGYHYRRLCTTAFYLRKKKKKYIGLLRLANFFFFFFFFFFFLGLRRFGCTQAITINVDRILTQMCDVLKLN